MLIALSTLRGRPFTLLCLHLQACCQRVVLPGYSAGQRRGLADESRVDDGAVAHLRHSAEPRNHRALPGRPHGPPVLRVCGIRPCHDARGGAVDREGLADRGLRRGLRLVCHPMLQLLRRGAAHWLAGSVSLRTGLCAGCTSGFIFCHLLHTARCECHTRVPHAFKRSARGTQSAGLQDALLFILGHLRWSLLCCALSCSSEGLGSGTLSPFLHIPVRPACDDHHERVQRHDTSVTLVSLSSRNCPLRLLQADCFLVKCVG